MSSSGASRVQKVTKPTTVRRMMASPSMCLTKTATSKSVPSANSFLRCSSQSFCNDIYSIRCDQHLTRKKNETAKIHARRMSRVHHSYTMNAYPAIDVANDNPIWDLLQLKRGNTSTMQKHQHLQKNLYHTTSSISKVTSTNVNIGNGLGPSAISSSRPSPSSPSPGQHIDISPVQRKNANIELERMIVSTQHILSSLSDHDRTGNDNTEVMDNNNAFIHEIRVALNYWVSRWKNHFHPYVTPSPTNVLPFPKPLSPASSSATSLDENLYCDYGSNQAMRIIQSLLLPKNKHIMVNFLSQPSSSTIFANLIDGILLPCMTNTTNIMSNNSRHQNTATGTGTATIIKNETQQDSMQQSQQQYVKFSSNTGLNNINPSMWKQCIFRACQVIDIFDDIIMSYSGDAEKGNINIEPDVHMYNARLSAWSKLVTLLTVLQNSANSGGLNKASSSISKRITDDEGNANNNLLDDDIIDWNDVLVSNLYCYSNSDSNATTETTISSKTIKTPRLCQTQSIEKIITTMEETIRTLEDLYHKTENELMKPNVNTYNVIIGALGRSQLPHSPNRTEWYLRRMEKAEDTDLKIFVEDENSREDLPAATAYADEVSYNLVLYAFAVAAASKNYNVDVKAEKALEHAKKAEEILKRMEERYNRTQRETAQPGTVSYSTVLHAYANAGKAPEAERILNQMIALSNIHSSSGIERNDSIPFVRPNIICFNTVIDAWSKTKGYASADKAYSILTQMEDLADNFENLYPDTISYSSVISAFARSGRDDAGDKAEELLQRSIKLFSEGQGGLKPDSITFITVLDALAKQCMRIYQETRKIDQCESMERRMKGILDQMDELQASGDDRVRPCTVSYNILLDFYAKTAQVDKSEQLIDFMTEQGKNGNNHVKPDIISYNAVLLVLSRSKRRGDLQNAVKLLESMENGLAIAVKPDTVSYNTVMNGLVRSSEPHSIKKVHDICLSMEERYRNGTSKVCPNGITYNICIDAWSKSGQERAVENVEEILEKMINSEGVNPDVFSFTSVISTIAKSGKADAPERCESVINRMKELGVKPNRYTYNNLINCWSKSGRQDAAEKAERILINMTEMNDPDVNPDSVTFSSVMNCWAQSGVKGSGERAERILDLMEDYSKSGHKNLKPNKFAYGAVLNAYAKSCDDNAVQKALNILNRMNEMYLLGNDDARPTEPSYNAGETFFPFYNQKKFL